VVMTHMRAKLEGQRSLGSKLVLKHGETATEKSALAPAPVSTVTMLNECSSFSSVKLLIVHGRLSWCRMAYCNMCSCLDNWPYSR